MVGAAALVAMTSLIAKTLGLSGQSSPALNPLQVSAGRFFFGFATVALVLAARPALRPGLSGAPWLVHALRSLCGWLGVTCMFAAVARMPIADATAISFLSPVFVVVLAVPLLGERLGPRKIAATLLAAVGAILILQPGTDAFQAAGLLALASALFMAFEMLFIKKLTASEPTARILLINNAIGMTISVVAATFVWQAPSPFQWLLLIAIGMIMVSSQILFIQAMKRGEASFVAPAFYSVLIFAAAYDLILYRATPAMVAVAGAALIVSGALLLAMRAEETG